MSTTVVTWPSIWKLEVDRWRHRWSIREPTDPLPQMLVETLDVANPAFYPAIYVAVKTLLTHPVLACAAERSFSLMKRLKTLLRNTMTDDHLSSLAILHIHKEKEINVESVLDQFAQHKELYYKMKNAAERMLEDDGIHNKNNVLFTPSLLKIRVRRFVLCLYSHNYFEQEIKNTVFLLSLLRFLDDVLVRTWKNDHTTHLCRCKFWEGKVPVSWHSII